MFKLWSTLRPKNDGELLIDLICSNGWPFDHGQNIDFLTAANHAKALMEWILDWNPELNICLYHPSCEVTALCDKQNGANNEMTADSFESDQRWDNAGGETVRSSSSPHTNEWLYPIQNHWTIFHTAARAIQMVVFMWMMPLGSLMDWSIDRLFQLWRVCISCVWCQDVQAMNLSIWRVCLRARI